MDAYKILALVPMKPDLKPQLRWRCMRQLHNLKAMMGDIIDVVTESGKQGDASSNNLRGRLADLAILRNSMIDKHLVQGYSHVLWIDADVFYTPVDVIQLMQIENSIVAPAVYMDGHYPRWYDVFGFIHNGLPARVIPPHFDSPDTIIDVESVGTMYVIPANVFRLGGRYADHPQWVEHYSLCEAARELGYGCKVRMDVPVFHCHLPDVGEAWHQ